MPDFILNSKVLTYVAGALVLVAIIAGTLGFIETSLMLTIIGFAGFGGVVSFRDWVDSQGWRTYVQAGLGILGTAAMALNWITIEQFILVIGIFGTGSAASLLAAAKKVPVGMPKLRSMNVMT